MILDAFWLFTGGSGGVGNNDGKTDIPTTGTQVSSNVIDIGLGPVGNPQIPPFAAGGGARDLGIGDDPALKMLIQVTTAFAGGTNIAVSLQGAPDNGSGAPGTYVTYATGPTAVLANLGVGMRLMDMDMPRLWTPAAPAPPRFLRLQYVSAGTFTGGGAIEGVVVLDRFDQIVGLTPAGTVYVLGGYVPGVTVQN